MSRKVCVSGGFDPLHYGHIRLFRNAAKLGSLIVIVNTDSWLIRKKGYVFMPLAERTEIISSIKWVNDIVIAKDDDGTVVENLKKLKPFYFCNGGDRDRNNTPEMGICGKLGIHMLWNVSGDEVKDVHSSQYMNKYERYLLNLGDVL